MTIEPTTPSRQWVEWLNRELDEATEEARPVLLADLGRAWLDVIDEERNGGEWLPGELDALAVAVSVLTQAVDAIAATPDEEHLEWLYDLGRAYGYRADARGDLGDYERAIGCIDQVAAALPVDDDRGDLLRLDLACLWWDRAMALRRDADHPDSDVAVADADALVRSLERLSPREPDSDAGRAWQILSGLGYLLRYSVGDRRVDLDVGIAQLSTGLWRLTPHAWGFSFAAAALAAAYLLRADADGDIGSLRACVDTAQRALQYGPGDDDATSAEHLEESLAWAHLECWVREAQQDDLARAIVWLRRLAEREDTDALVFAELGRAYRAMDDVAGSDEILWQADAAYQRAIDAGPDDSTLLEVYAGRLDVAHRLTTRTASPSSESVQLFASLIQQSRRALDRAVTADTDLRGIFAGLLALNAYSVAGQTLAAPDLTWIKGLAAMAWRVRDAPSSWPALLAMVESMEEFISSAQRSGEADDYGVSGLAGVLARHDGADMPDVRSLIASTLRLRAIRQHDLRIRRQADQFDRRIASTFNGAARTVAAEDECDDHVMKALVAAKPGDMRGFAEHVDAAVAALARTPEDARVRHVLRPMVAALQSMAATVRGHAPAGPIEHPAPRPANMDPRTAMAVDGVQAFARLAEAERVGNPTGLRACAGELVHLAQRDGLGGALPYALRGLAGMAYLWASRRDRSDRASIELAVRHLEEARGGSIGRGEPVWAMLTMGLAEALRRAGPDHRARSRALGLQALASRARLVMLQAEPADALQVARQAESDAATLAAWCLQDNALSDLVGALDAGRGLVLQATTGSRDVAHRLDELGYGRLANEWRGTAGRGRDELVGAVDPDLAGILVPDTLRAKVLDALAGDGAGVFDPVKVELLPDALTAAGADALVYLVGATTGVPGVPGVPGCAVIVARVGEVCTLPLPELAILPGTPVHGYLSAVTDPDGEGHVRLPGRLEEIGRWAWRVAMAPLAAHATRWRLPQPARVVLVPLGALAMIPWHAAFYGGVRRRYVLEQLVISYSPSAHMFQAAALRPAPGKRRALFVGGPGGDLTSADDEALAVYRAFYAGMGTYLGGASATRTQVLRWIDAAAGSSVLHFACHAEADPANPTESAILLEGDALSTRDLVEATRLAALVIDQVFLAACTTGVVGEHYDEAFSLAGCFIAAGARTAFGSLWAVPDIETSLFMFMVHYCLVGRGQLPAQALRSAQLWMLDPERKPPASMPPELARHHRRPTLDQPMAWAAFIHLGR